jgi:acylphosphatase
MVETVAEGSHEKLGKFAEAVKIGPRTGRVDDVKIEWEPATGEFKNFSIKYGT